MIFSNSFLSSLFGQPSSLAANLNSPSSLQDEMDVYHQRRLENLETQKIELNREVGKGRKLIVRLHSEIDRLKNQIKAYQNATAMANAGSISFETFYLRDLVGLVERSYLKLLIFILNLKIVRG